ncbi:Rab3 GTPase-activating protein non-catalytic subunit [Trichoplax sp. H2]|nr:Rab3 GTPase-activating protein non-catalytic subunit [Trichoplax sp. H2]|eukprot:RDD42557.1 Rab3 GTPase-activating protein non-catalytic subunit [Trichoplax sp. H2]
MACKLQFFAKAEELRLVYEDWASVNQAFDEEIHPDDLDDDWNTDWVLEGDDEKERFESEFKKWINSCHMAFSPAGDVLLVADDHRIAILTRNYQKSDDSKEETTCFCRNRSKYLSDDPKEKISQVIVIPIASQLRSSQGGPDWTCIVVGFSSGYIRIYEQGGGLLLSQIFHDDPVINLKCRTSPNIHKHCTFDTSLEELIVLYANQVVVIEGFSLYQCLRACRNQLARATAQGAASDIINQASLAYRKLHLRYHSEIRDIASCGSLRINDFHYFQSITMTNNASIVPRDATVARYISAGGDPVVGLYNAADDKIPSFASVVVSAVATKLKDAVLSAASGWLGFGQSTADAQPKVQKPNIESGSPLDLRYGLPDDKRVVDKIIPAPNSALAVTVDNLARVLLIDTETGMAIRMWKGYRDAQCGWIQVFEQHSNHTGNQSSRRGLFLVIYAARRGILEIWLMQNGPRVAVFNIGKNCRLLYTGHDTLGVRFAVQSDVLNPRGWNLCCCLILQPDGTLKSISIPFYCSLSGKEGAVLRDKTTLNELSCLLDNLIETEDDESAEPDLRSRLTKIFDSFVLPTSFQQAMSSVLNCSKVKLHTLLYITEELKLKTFGKDTKEASLIHLTCCIQQQLLDVYDALIKSKCDYSGDKTASADTIESAIDIDTEEFDKLLLSLNRYHECTRRILGQSKGFNQNFSAIQWLNSFDLHFLNVDQKSSKHQIFNGIMLSGNLSEDEKLALGGFMFSDVLSGMTSVSDIIILLKSLDTNLLQFLAVLYLYWLDIGHLERYDDIKPVVRRLYLLTLGIISSEGLKRLTTQHCTIADFSVLWWEYFHNIIYNSVALGEAAVLSLILQAVIKVLQSHEGEVMESIKEEPESNEWIELSKETVQWTLSYQRLLDLIAISEFASFSFSMKHNDGAKNTTDEQMPPALLNISLKMALSSGKAFFPKLISEYLVDNCQNICKLLSLISKERIDIDVDDGDDSWMKEVRRLQNMLPELLETSKLSSYCSIRCATLWKENKEEINNLKSAVNIATVMSDTVLKSGLCIKIWRDYFEKGIRDILGLMDKVGKAPKDRLCRKISGMSENSLEEFLLQSTLLLATISKITDAEMIPISNTVDELWNEISGPETLIDDILAENSGNNFMIQLHRQICSVLYLIMTLRMRSIKPTTLFDTKSKEILFQELSKNTQIPNVTDDASFINARTKFGLSVASAITDSLPSITEENVSEACKETAAGVAFKRFEMLRFLCRTFNGIDKDDIERKIVCELFLRGYDAMAQEAASSVEDESVLGQKLLTVAGQRLAAVLFADNKVKENVASWSNLPPHVYNWIKSQESDSCAVCHLPLRSTLTILQFAAKILSKDSEDFITATNVIEAITYLL